MCINLKSVVSILSFFVVVNPALTLESILLPDLFRPELMMLWINASGDSIGPKKYQVLLLKDPWFLLFVFLFQSLDSLF